MHLANNSHSAILSGYCSTLCVKSDLIEKYLALASEKHADICCNRSFVSNGLKRVLAPGGVSCEPFATRRFCGIAQHASKIIGKGDLKAGIPVKVFCAERATRSIPDSRFDLHGLLKIEGSGPVKLKSRHTFTAIVLSPEEPAPTFR